VQTQHAQPGQVDRGGQQAEVGGDLDKAADPHPATAVAAADQMGQLALHLRSGRAVVGGAVGVGLAGTSSGQLGLIGGDGDGAASRCAGALAAKRAPHTRRAEAGLAVVAVARIGVVDDRDRPLRRASHRVDGKVDPELVLGEVPARRDRSLDLEAWVNAGGVQAGQQRPGAVGAIAVNGGRGPWQASIGDRRCGGRWRVGADLVDQLG
jgi:hypothetical protein